MFDIPLFACCPSFLKSALQTVGPEKNRYLHAASENICNATASLSAET